ncbi:MAG TPA: NAD(P)/FAD-dependent oxidoreductase [Puia sp.]|uniref:FAD-dependent oxidoreductase n=1 Tax=Puia sp. TaxID=2045100 RepID=UPI002D0EFA16|nr:NAD(P)/FAD-dependent oxidoreductase [Puia sp.]HVU94511.1 NAD(P)/FAD-dependent oxidoreductase [Puia sp.]
MKKQKAIIVGAGPVGSLLAILLARKGIRVLLLEKRLAAGRPGGTKRSINLALSYRGWKALRSIDAEQELLPLSMPLYGRMTHDKDQLASFHPYDDRGRAIHAIPRDVLNDYLLEKVRKEPLIHFYSGRECLQIDINRAQIMTRDTFTGMTTTESADVIIGADGVHSLVRQAIDREEGRNSHLEFSPNSYMELSLPASVAAKRLTQDALHIWPRHHRMLIALPNLDGSFNCTLFMPTTGRDSFDSLTNRRSWATLFSENFPDMADIIDQPGNDLSRRGYSSLQTVLADAWHSRGKAMVIGDAARSILPFFGQGMNAGFEDCTILAALLNRSNDWTAILPAFQEMRKKDSAAITDLSAHNFEEMASKMADPLFLQRKKLDAHLQKAFPTHWRSLYTMVTFTDTPYAQALDVSRKQDRLLDELLLLYPDTASFNNIDLSELLQTTSPSPLTF